MAGGRIARERPRVSALGLPEDATGGEARITLVGATRALVENCRGILEITPVCVRLATKRGCVCFTGEALSVCEAREDALTVRGRIADIALPCEGRRESDA